MLVDFGLARIDDESPLTAAHLCFGSPSYLAPERLLGKPYDGRVDLYSAGVIFYELLTGMRPFGGAAPLEIARRQVMCPPPPLRTFCPDVPPLLEAAILRSLAKDPTARFADAAAMRDALGAALVDDRRANRSDEAATAVFAEIRPVRPPLSRRLLGWLRYGPWRWRLASA